MPTRRSMLKTLLALILPVGGMVRAENAALSCAEIQAQGLDTRKRRWMMETLWAYRFHAEGATPRPMGIEQQVNVDATDQWIKVDFITGDTKNKRQTGGFSSLTDDQIIEDLTRALTAVGVDIAACDPRQIRLYSSVDKYSPTMMSDTYVVPLRKDLAVATRRIVRKPENDIAFWDREIFILRG